MKNISLYILGAQGPWYAAIGIFSSQKKADNAWKKWKHLMRGTVWSKSRKEISVEKLNKFIIGK